MLLLGVLLLVFPIGSYIYLQRGYDYQLASWNEIDPQGPVASLVEYPRPDSTLDIVYFADAPIKDSVRQALIDVHKAFDDNPAVRFVGLGKGAAEFLNDPAQSIAVQAVTKTPSELERALGDVSIACASIPLHQRAYLVDRQGQVRRCYNLHSGVEVNRLVEQLALLIPRPKAEDIVLERKTEL